MVAKGEWARRANGREGWMNVQDEWLKNEGEWSRRTNGREAVMSPAQGSKIRKKNIGKLASGERKLANQKTCVAKGKRKSSAQRGGDDQK